MNRAEKRATDKAIKKSKPIKLADQPKVELPKDLSDKWAVIEQIATTAALLQKGTFLVGYMTAIHKSVEFLTKFHEASVEDLLTHPEAHLIPELKDVLDQRKKDTADGKTN